MSLAVSPEAAVPTGTDINRVDCSECYFGVEKLCSLPQQDKCSTFRPAISPAR